jgi:hypothetical protein
MSNALAYAHEIWQVDFMTRRRSDIHFTQTNQGVFKRKGYIPQICISRIPACICILAYTIERQRIEPRVDCQWFFCSAGGGGSVFHPLLPSPFPLPSPSLPFPSLSPSLPSLSPFSSLPFFSPPLPRSGPP